MSTLLRWERATPVALLLFVHEVMSATGESVKKSLAVGRDF